MFKYSQKLIKRQQFHIIKYQYDINLKQNRPYSSLSPSLSGINSIYNFDKYSTLNDKHLQYFKEELNLQPNEIITDPFDLQVYNTDWIGKYKGKSKLVLQPDTPQKISKILAYCNENKLPVVPQGGNTGLVGGSVPILNEIVLSTSRLNKILDFDADSLVITCESGCILENLNKFLLPYNCEIPLDLGAKGACQIGGNIATNAGGIKFVKFGPFKSYILGLEVVLPNGCILNFDSKIRKDNTGFDLKQLFIGSEGILGIITKAYILACKIDKYRKVFFVKCASYDHVLKINRLIRESVGRNLSAIEYTDEYGYNSVIKNIMNISKPFEISSTMQNFYVLFEISGNDPLDDIENRIYELLVSNQLIQDCVLSQSEKDLHDLWKIRESIAEGCNKVGLVFKYDISLPIQKMNELVTIMRQKTEGLAYTAGYGHIGDGNLHINICLLEKENKYKLANLIEPFIFEWLHKIRGSISAEHGLGLMKAKYIHLAKDKPIVEYMKHIKNMFDPNWILNPYKVLLP